jgi:glycerate kinase
MRVICAPNAFKGSLTAPQAAAAMAAGVQRAVPEAEVLCKPVSDGGDGLTEVMAEVLGGELRTAAAAGPLGREREAPYAYVEASRTGIVEMARASGLALLEDEEQDPTRTSTRGTGDLIRAALDDGARRLIVGIGGSATCDGGTGMAAALGARFLDDDGREVEPRGGTLRGIRRIDLAGLDPRLAQTAIEVACDVDNPLLGPSGAARVYAPQKGASPEQVEELEAGLQRLAEVIEADLGRDVRDEPGAGAAGGLGAGLCVFLGADLRRGIDIVLDVVGLAEAVRGADLVLTAEGALDNQTAFGKAPAGVARIARRLGVPCLALAGAVEPPLDKLREAGILAAFSICPRPVDLAEALARAEAFLTHATEQAVRTFRAGGGGD